MEDRTKAELKQFDEMALSHLDAYQTFRTIQLFISTTLRWFSTPLECFLRREFGERYMSWLRLWVSISPIWILVIVPTIFGRPSTLLWVIYFVYILMGFHHRFVIWKRNRKGEYRHSQFEGIPWGIFNILPLNFQAIHVWVEPIFCILVSFCVFFVSKITGFWLLISSVALIIHRQLDYMADRNRELDKLDAEIDAYYETQMRTGSLEEVSEDPLKNEGWVPPPKDLRNIRRERKPIAQTVQEAMG